MQNLEKLSFDKTIFPKIFVPLNFPEKDISFSSIRVSSKNVRLQIKFEIDL